MGADRDGGMNGTGMRRSHMNGRDTTMRTLLNDLLVSSRCGKEIDRGPGPSRNTMFFGLRATTPWQWAIWGSAQLFFQSLYISLTTFSGLCLYGTHRQTHILVIINTFWSSVNAVLLHRCSLSSFQDFILYNPNIDCSFKPNLEGL